MKTVEIYQALWAMEAYPSFDHEIPLTEALVKIENSGFDGVLQYIEDNDTETVSKTEEILNTNLKLGFACRGYNIEDVEKKLKYVAKYKGEFVNILLLGYFIRGRKAIDYIKQVKEIGEKLGVRVFIETHRGTITQDLNATIDYINVINDLELTIDLSHYVVAGEIDVTNDLIEKAFDQLLQHTGSIHVRVSNGQQIQLSMDTIKEEQLNNFKRWWAKGLNYASKRNLDKPIPIVVELGPFPYQLMVGGHVDYDRYVEAIKWMEYFRDL